MMNSIFAVFCLIGGIYLLFTAKNVEQQIGALYLLGYSKLCLIHLDIERLGEKK